MDKNKIRNILCKYLRIAIEYFYSSFIKIVKSAFNWININWKQDKYLRVNIAFTLILMLIAVFLNVNNEIYWLILKLLFCATNIIVSILCFLSLVKLKSKLSTEHHYYNMYEWYSLQILSMSAYIIILNSIYPNSVDFFGLLIGIFFYLTFYSYGRYFVAKWIKKWWTFALLFFAMPLIALLIGTIGSGIFASLFNIDLIQFDPFLGFIVIVTTILLINYIIASTPESLVGEVKVAIYLILAISSAISYCFFAPEYLTNFLVENIKLLEYTNKNEIIEVIDSILKWVTLPYSIGSVFGCFTIELVERNNRIFNANKMQDEDKQSISIQDESIN